MDLQQLQLLAGRARDLRQQSNHTVGHNQSLDLIAALPGLRNWPEVRAFPDRVAACELDEVSARRLAFRLRKKFGLEVSPPDILVALNGADARDRSLLPQTWPSGPEPGVIDSKPQGQTLTHYSSQNSTPRVHTTGMPSQTATLQIGEC